jgi:hypothetical protein
MATSYRIDNEQHLLFTRATGVLGEEDLRALWRAILRDPEIRRGLNELNDATGVTACQISTSFVWESAESCRRFDSDERVRGRKVALSLSEAREWLGLPERDGDTNSNWKEV